MKILALLCVLIACPCAAQVYLYTGEIPLSLEPIWYTIDTLYTDGTYSRGLDTLRGTWNDSLQQYEWTTVPGNPHSPLFAYIDSSKVDNNFPDGRIRPSRMLYSTFDGWSYEKPPKPWYKLTVGELWQKFSRWWSSW